MNQKPRIVIYPDKTATVNGQRIAMSELSRYDIDQEDFENVQYNGDAAIKFNTPTAFVVVFPPPGELVRGRPPKQQSRGSNAHVCMQLSFFA